MARMHGSSGLPAIFSAAPCPEIGRSPRRRPPWEASPDNGHGRTDKVSRSVDGVSHLIEGCLDLAPVEAFGHAKVC